jgi:hypothetical protein
LVYVSIRTRLLEATAGIPGFIRSHSGDLLDPNGCFRSGRKIGSTGKSTAVVIADPKAVKSEAV